MRIRISNYKFSFKWSIKADNTRPKEGLNPISP